jgi:hypothetical protein
VSRRRTRRRLDQQLEAVALEDLVVVALLVERELVLEARAAAAADADTKACNRDVGALCCEILARLLGTLVCHRNHCF